MGYLLGMLVRIAAIVLGGALLMASCSSPPFKDVPNPVIGQVTLPVGLDTFILTTATGARYEFRNANPEDPDSGQEHLRSHLADRNAVQVTWRHDGYELVAVAIVDVTVSTPTPG